MMDPRLPLLNSLNIYVSHWFDKPVGIEEDRGNIRQLTEFISSHTNCFSRGCVPGHITASGLIVTEDFSQVLLTHHKKLGLWLQLGGHCDGNSNVHEVAQMECLEESGLKDLRIFDPKAFLGGQTSFPMYSDIDIHEIPAYGNDPRHLHYDIRYIVTAKNPEAIQISDESNDLRWFPLNEAFEVANQRSMHRQFEKVRFFNELIKGN